MRYVLYALIAVLMCACQPAEEPDAPDPAEPVGDMDSATAEPEVEAPDAEATEPQTGPLETVLQSQPDDVQARYDARHPRETLEFFGIEPGMTVVEGLPSSGWYTRILVPYLGSEGHLIGANYAMDMWPHFRFGTEEFVEQMRQWSETFPKEAEAWCEEDCAPVSTFYFGSLPEEMAGTADAVIYVRLLHNLARFQNAGIDDFLEQALADAFTVLKPGGTFGVVQHQAREDMPDDWADGNAGYLKKSFVVERAEAAGFELVDSSDINANPNDRPSTEEVVWRLPPSLRVPDDAEDPEALRAQYEAIGESNRMTLKFRKPSRE